MSDNTRKKYGLSAFLPLAAFLIVYLGSGILFTALGYGSEAFKQIPRTFALVVALFAMPNIPVAQQTRTKFDFVGSICLFIAVDWLNANQPQTGAAQQRIAFGEGGLWLAV